MKITKLVHSCLLVEMPAPTNRTVLFDPGVYSADAVRSATLQYLDDIVITHTHPDHFDQSLVAELVEKFPEVRIIGPQQVVDVLQAAGISASTAAPEGMAIIESPHEPLDPIGPTPQAIGVHYLDILTHPGDSHHFAESKEILALPVTAPWGTTMRAAELIETFKPTYVIPIHDYMWREDWQQNMYAMLEAFCQERQVQFVKPVNGQPFVLNLETAQPS